MTDPENASTRLRDDLVAYQNALLAFECWLFARYGKDLCAAVYDDDAEIGLRYDGGAGTGRRFQTLDGTPFALVHWTEAARYFTLIDKLVEELDAVVEKAPEGLRGMGEVLTTVTKR